MSSNPSVVSYAMVVVWDKTSACSTTMIAGRPDGTNYKFQLSSNNLEAAIEFRKLCSEHESFKNEEFVILRGTFIAEEEL